VRHAGTKKMRAVTLRFAQGDIPREMF